MGRAVIPVDVNNSTVQQSVKLKGKGRNAGEELPGSLTVKISCFAELKSV